MNSGDESLGIHLQTIRILMNSRIYDQSEYQSQNEEDSEEEQEFLNQLVYSLLELQDKLRQEKFEKEKHLLEKQDQQSDLINKLQQEVDILDQQNNELIKIVQNEDEQYMQMTNQLAKTQLSNFQSGQIMQNLEKQFYEGNKYKIKTEEINLQNKILREKKLQLLNEEQIIQNQIESQNKTMKKLHKEHQQTQTQHRLFERKLSKMKKQQDNQIFDNQKQKDNMQSMQNSYKQLIEQSQALMTQRDSLQFQIDEVIVSQNNITSISARQSKVFPSISLEDSIQSKQTIRNSFINSDQNLTCLRDELGDQFSDTFHSPVTSIKESEKDDFHHQTGIYNIMSNHPFTLDEQDNNVDEQQKSFNSQQNSFKDNQNANKDNSPIFFKKQQKYLDEQNNSPYAQKYTNEIQNCMLVESQNILSDNTFDEQHITPDNKHKIFFDQHKQQYKQRNSNIYETSGGTTEQSSTYTRRSSETQGILKIHPVKLNKILLNSDYEGFNEVSECETKCTNESTLKINEIPLIMNESPSKLNFNQSPTRRLIKEFPTIKYVTEYPARRYENDQSPYKIKTKTSKSKNRLYNQKMDNKLTQQNDNPPQQLNHGEIKDICSNIISWLTYKPLMTFKNNNNQLFQSN